MRDWMQRQRFEGRPRRWRWLAGSAFLVIAGGVLWWVGRAPRTAPERSALPPPPPPFVVSSGTIGVGGSLGKSLEEQGFSPAESSAIEKALRPVFNARHAQAKDTFEVHRSSSGEFRQFLYRQNPFEYYTITATSGTLKAAAQQEPLTESIVGVQGEIRTSLWESMVKQGVPPEMIYRFAEVFSWRFDFLTEPRQGDTYRMVWKRLSGNGALRDEDILAAEYKSKDKGDLLGIPFNGDYYDADGDSLRGQFLRAPLAYRRISSVFTERRFHPVLRYYRPHHGIDYSAARGTPVVSIGDGVVFEMKRGYNKGLGNEIRVRHSGSYVSIYGHLMGFAAKLRPGARVKQGQVLGYVGSTGLSTGPHLHFGFERSGTLINFFTLRLRDKRQTLSKSSRAAFDSQKRQALERLESVLPGQVQALKQGS